MTQSRESPDPSIDVSSLPPVARKAAAEFFRKMEAPLASDDPQADFAEAELELAAELAALGRGFLKAMIESRDDGGSWFRAESARGRVMTLLGEVSCWRSRCRRRGGPSGAMVSIRPGEDLSTVRTCIGDPARACRRHAGRSPPFRFADA